MVLIIENRQQVGPGDNVHTPQHALAVSQARQHLLKFGSIPSTGLDDRVARSWSRSLAAGLLPDGRMHSMEHSSEVELRQTLMRNHELLAHSRPVMEYLFEQVRHGQNVVVLADQRGTLMHTLGDAVFLDKAQRVALSCGASWHEAQRGTNAIGTALAEVNCVEIHGSEHFLERNGFLTCAASPIMSADGSLMGVLDISGDQHNGHPHTLGLVSTAARMIENRLMTASGRRGIRLHMHTQAEGIGTVAEGIVSISDDGWLIGANRAAMAFLQLSPCHLGKIQVSSLADVRMDELLSRGVRKPDQPLQIRLCSGKFVFAVVHAQAFKTPAAVIQKTMPPEQQQFDALSCLDTGDLRWRSAADKARRVLDKPIPVLIQGESGVGKEYFARAMHDTSSRRTGPFVAINCGAIPENLIEAELFGYASGAFTGARKEGSLGRLREANGGTLFLDEIGDMPMGMQTRLLRVLQERCVTPLGGGRSMEVDFALVCATHSRLREETEKGRFRSDLYYRINGLTIQLPPLRERTDFQSLTQRLLAGLNPEREIQLGTDVLQRMEKHAWPGNLRQLANVLRTSSAMLGPDEDCIEWCHLPDDIAEDLAQAAAPVPSGRPTPTSHNLEEIALTAIANALDSSQGNVSQAARMLGISRQTMYRKMGARSCEVGS
jgi:transcriptional regulator of acetoin/glycerol metabolism